MFQKKKEKIFKKMFLTKKDKQNPIPLLRLIKIKLDWTTSLGPNGLVSMYYGLDIILN